MTAPTTAGTANGMKKIVRKNGAPLRHAQVEDAWRRRTRSTSITGIWIAAKMITRTTPDQNMPDCRVWV